MRIRILGGLLLVGGVCFGGRAVQGEPDLCHILRQRLLTEMDLWPVVGRPRAMPLKSQQLSKNAHQFELFHHDEIRFDFDVRNQYDLKVTDTRDLASRTPGSIYLLANAFYLYAPHEFEYVARQLRHSEGGERVFRQVQFINGEKRDTQVVVLAAKDFDLLIFQGSGTAVDWQHNLDARPYRPTMGKTWEYYHSGFYRNLQEVLPQVNGVLQKFAANATESRPLIVAGHSLGGALAQIYAARALTEKKFFAGAV